MSRAPGRKDLRYLGVVGRGTPDASTDGLAYEVGREVARVGAVLVCGGRGGVMEAACRGARKEGGRSVGILPGTDRAEANPYLDLSVVTGMGEGRNVLVVRSSDALIALPGGAGTLSEVALALKMDRPVVSLGGWDHLDGVLPARSPEGAVARALATVLERGRPG